jgi:plastocyanin
MRLAMRTLLGVVLVTLPLAACGDDAPSDEGGSPGGGLYGGGTVAETGATGSTGPTDATGATGATTATGTTGAGGGLEVSLNNYLFDPNPVEVASGDVIAVRNGNTRTPHTFTVVGQDVDLELGPLETETVEIALEPGTYDLICRFHEAQDMTATLVVT